MHRDLAFQTDHKDPWYMSVLDQLGRVLMYVIELAMWFVAATLQSLTWAFLTFIPALLLFAALFCSPSVMQKPIASFTLSTLVPSGFYSFPSQLEDHGSTHSQGRGIPCDAGANCEVTIARSELGALGSVPPKYVALNTRDYYTDVYYALVLLVFLSKLVSRLRPGRQ